MRARTWSLRDIAQTCLRVSLDAGFHAHYRFRNSELNIENRKLRTERTKDCHAGRMAGGRRCRRHVHGRGGGASHAPRDAHRQGSLPLRRPRGRPARRAPGGRSRMAGCRGSDSRDHPRDQRHHRGRPGRGCPDRDPGLLRYPGHRAPEPAPPLPPRPCAQARPPGAGCAALRGERAARSRRPGARSDGSGLGRRGDPARRGQRRGGGGGVAAALLRQPRSRGSAGRAAARALPLRRAVEPGQSAGPGVRAHRDHGAERRGHAARSELPRPARGGEAAGVEAASVPLRRRDGFAAGAARAAARARRLRPRGGRRCREPDRRRSRHRPRHQLRHGWHHHRRLPGLRR